ncbi:MAG: pentapeptide repeat-containing protein [Candidatus Paceibacterota bacterium]
MELSTFKGNEDHLAVILKAIEQRNPSIWNEWKNNEKTHPNLEGVDLSNQVLHNYDFQFTNLMYANLRNCKMTTRFDYANLNYANLSNTFLWTSTFEETQIKNASLEKCDFQASRIQATFFTGSNLKGANFYKCDLEDSSFEDCDLRYAIFQDAYMLQTNFKKCHCYGTNFRNANLKYANFEWATIMQSDFTSAVLNNIDFSKCTIKYCKIYGIAAWDLKLNNSKRSNFIISKEGEAAITVDDMEMAQFIHLLINNYKIRDIINTITSKSVLILGRFYEERKNILDTLRDELRKKDLVPIIFDFQPSENRDLTETIQLLANMSKFIVADLTDAKSIPHELSHIIPFLPSVPVQPILWAKEKVPYSMYEHWDNFTSVLPIFSYDDKTHLIRNLDKAILEPIEEWKSQRDMTSKANEQLEKLEELKRKNPQKYQELKNSGIII